MALTFYHHQNSPAISWLQTCFGIFNLISALIVSWCLFSQYVTLPFFCGDRLIALLFHYTAIAYYYSSIIKYLQKKRAGTMMDVIEHGGATVGWAHQQGASTSGSMLACLRGRTRTRGDAEALRFGRNNCAVIIQMRSLRPNRVLETTYL